MGGGEAYVLYIFSFFLPNKNTKTKKSQPTNNQPKQKALQTKQNKTTKTKTKQHGQSGLSLGFRRLKSYSQLTIG